MTRRPSLPVGMHIGSLPEVVRANYVSSELELYTLGKTETVDLVHTHLLLDRGALPCSHEDYVAWLDSQDRTILVSCRPIHSSQLPTSAAAFALTLKGVAIAETSLIEAGEAALQNLFISVAQLLLKYEKSNLIPAFLPDLSWWSEADTRLCCIAPRPAGEVSNLLRYAVTAFYGFAVGTFPEADTAPPPLSQWCKFAGSKLGEIVQRCYLGGSAKQSITSLLGLVAALQGVESHSLADREPRETPASTDGLSRVAGMAELKKLLERDVIKPIRDPETYARYGLSIPNGILLFGPPGCGKTYIARQLAEELGHYFVELIPSEIASPYIHDTVLKIKDAFERAAENAPAVLFIDEFDALVPARADLAGQQQYKSEEVNEFLAQLNGCAEKKILIVAATNEPNKIDPAVKRTGRIDKIVYVGPPDAEARRDMISYHLKGRPVAEYIDVPALAEQLEGYSASDIRFLIDEAARSALATEQGISEWLIRKAMRTVPPSISAASDAAYRNFEQRGI